jgi:hypothetical protein
MKAKVVTRSIVALIGLVCIPLPTYGEPTPAEALEHKITPQFISAPLQDVVDFMVVSARVNIEVGQDIDRQQPITVRMKDVPLKTALQGVLEPQALTFTVQQDRILIVRDKTKAQPPEYGHRLKPEDALEGWISLFDGKTTFGWKNAKIDRGLLEGGETTSTFGDFLLRAYIGKAGRITVGNKTIDVKRGEMRREVVGKGPIIVREGTGVLTLAIQPLGLKPLFNGEDLDRWQRIDRQNIPEEKRPKWRVESGAIRATGGPGALEHPERFGDFVLQVDVKTLAEHANGGLFFRSRPGDVMNGYEAQIYNRMIDNDPAQPFKYSTGSLDDRQLARRVVSRDGVTFRMTVIAHGPHIATWVNGYQLVDWTDTRAPHDNPRQGLRVEPGTLQLQAHDPETDVEFRAINIAELK